MWREEENISYQEVDAVKNKNVEAVTVEDLQAEPRCIVQHPGFEGVCLNVCLLQTAWLQYKQQYGSSAYEGPKHKKNRHIAYRQPVRWCWVPWAKISGFHYLLVQWIAYMPTFQSPTNWRRAWSFLVLLMQMSKVKCTGINYLLLPFVMPLHCWGKRNLDHTCTCILLCDSFFNKPLLMSLGDNNPCQSLS